jgi:methionyl-tRNA formyltransferase
MRLFFLTNNEITKSLVGWLREKAAEEVVVWQDKLSSNQVASAKPDFLISYNYRHYIRQGVLGLFGARGINLHISYLPWNRGAHPNLWSFLEDSPKGVTIHVLDSGIDTGDILLQKAVPMNPRKETFSSSYATLHREIQALFVQNWDRLKNLAIEPKRQPPGGTVHTLSDFEKIKHVLGRKGWDAPVLEVKQKYEELRSHNGYQSQG